MATNIAPSGLKTWHAFAFLIIVAVVYYYIGKPLLLFAAITAFVWAWSLFCRRFPRTAFFIVGFTRGLLRGRRRRW